MRWKYCNYCLINGACENQDRGRECEMPVKKLCEENDKLKELLKECREVVKNYNFFVMGTLPKESDLITKIDEVLQ